MKINKKIIVAMMVLALLTVSCGKKKPKGNSSTARPVKVQVIGQNQMSLGYTASGSIKGIEEIPYTATSSGEVVVINGKNGDYVNAGQVIVAIDNQAARSGVREAVSNVRTAESNISSAHGDISAAKGNIASAAAAVEEARINYQKYKMLYDKRLITETDFLTAQTKLSSAQANLATANDTNSKTVIKTKVSGYIANMDLERHQQVSAGAKLFTLVNESEMKLEIGVPAEIVKKIQMGAQATIKVDELNGKEIVGTVYEIAASADSASRQFIVKVKFPNPDRELKSGMYGKANIATGAEDGLIIPKKAIVVRGVQQVVYVIRDGKAVMIPINISNQNETYAAVTGDGLTAGDQLVVDGQNVVQANEKVNIVQ